MALTKGKAMDLQKKCNEAATQAVAELGPEAPWIDLTDRTFDILDENGISTDTHELCDLEESVDKALMKKAH